MLACLLALLLTSQLNFELSRFTLLLLLAFLQ